MSSLPFWRAKTLEAMTPDEWESLCDGCGRCCLAKLEDEETGEVAYTDVACRLLDIGTCRCINYDERTRYVPDCIVLTPETIAAIGWMPSTCAYRLIKEGKDLPAWHPLVSGDPDAVHRAGISVRGRVVPEDESIELEDHIVLWPE